MYEGILGQAVTGLALLFSTLFCIPINGPALFLTKADSS